ncbi:MAG: sulfotransferase [Bacteroidetes bacterium]|nr:sulfotransferase [Bacteroidota bacterium]
MNIPNFLIVGAAKSGTSSLHNYLSMHDEICMPTVIKELNFWHVLNHEQDRAILKLSNLYPLSPEAYTDCFSHRTSNQITGESSPSYLYYYEDTVNNLKALKANWEETRIIIILREPIDKIWSHFKFCRNYQLDPENLSLEEALKQEETRLVDTSLLLDLYYVDNTRYYDQVKHYLENFKNVKILLYDDFKKDAQATLDEITQFLGIANFTPQNLREKYNVANPAVVPKKGFKLIQGKGLARYFPKFIRKAVSGFLVKNEEIDAYSREFLVKTFKLEIEKLNVLIENDLSPWLKKYE